MPVWAWVVSLFVMLTVGYFIGFCGGIWKSGDDCPTENAWINVRKYSIDAQKETAIANINAEHEEQMALIARGAFDNLDFDEEEQEDGGNA